MELIVKHVETLDAGGGGEPGHHLHLPNAAGGGAVALLHVAAADEAFVRLGVVELANDGPDEAEWGGDGLYHGGPALVGGQLGVVVTTHHVLHPIGHLRIHNYTPMPPNNYCEFTTSIVYIYRGFLHIYRGSMLCAASKYTA